MKKTVLRFSINICIVNFCFLLYRCLLGYYLETLEDDLPWLEVPLHTVIKLEPIAYGCKVHYVQFPVDCVSTHRRKPSRPGYLAPRY